MYIRSVSIKNYRGFTSFTAVLQKLTVIIGENDTGKTNFLTAISLALSGNQIDYNQKRLSISDINKDCILDFYSSVINGEDHHIQLQKIPKVSVTIEFFDPKDSYETAILAKWIDPEGDGFKISYEFQPKNDLDVLDLVNASLTGKTLEDVSWFTLPVELYDYQIVSANNGKPISFNDLTNVSINNINADRDDFSENSSMKSNGVFTKLLMKTLNDKDKGDINDAYSEFFSSIEKTETFEKIVGNNTDFDNYHDLVDKLECTPNLPNLKSILSNITLKYGDEFLYQKGLGQRNLIYILILFSYYKSCNDTFNLCSIEEPEAHLSVNNLRLVRDFIQKIADSSNSLMQTIISTHNPTVINKLKISNVLAFSGNKAINLSNTSPELLDYLRKRPNFDILKLLFANRVILVEGTTEEMLINCYLMQQTSILNDIDIIVIGHRGFTKFLDLWLELNKDNKNKKIGIIRDLDNSEYTKKAHDAYDNTYDNVTVRTTKGYTLENDLVVAGNNLSLLSGLFDITEDKDVVSKHIIDGKAARMLDICDAMLNKINPLNISLPEHIADVIKEVS